MKIKDKKSTKKVKGKKKKTTGKSQKIPIKKSSGFTVDDVKKGALYEDEDGKTFTLIRQDVKGNIYYCKQYAGYTTEKGSRPKLVYIGSPHPVTGIIEKVRTRKFNDKPPSNVLVSVRKDLSYGSFYLLNKITQEIGLRDVLLEAFLKDLEINYKISEDEKASAKEETTTLVDEIIGIAMAIACQDSKLYLLQNWFEKNYCTYGGRHLSSSYISTLLPKITFSKRNLFFEHWIKSKSSSGYLAYDITSVSSYSNNSLSVEYGYNRDGEKLKQINLALLYGEDVRIPLHYRTFRGGLKDVSTIDELLTALSTFNVDKVKFVIDKGGYSKENIESMNKRGYIFSIAVPFSNKWSRDVVAKNSTKIVHHNNYSVLHNRYCMTTTVDHYGEEMIAHIYYDPQKNASDMIEFEKLVSDGKAALSKVKTIQEDEDDKKKYTNSELDIIIKKYKGLFKIKKFTVSSNGKNKVKSINYSVDAEEYSTGLKLNGYLVIASNDNTLTAEEALTVYREKEVAENAFDDVKNLLDADRLNTHSEDTSEGKLFIVFLSLIYVSLIRRVMNLKKDMKGFKGYAYKEIIQELEKIKFYTCENGERTRLLLTLGGKSG